MKKISNKIIFIYTLAVTVIGLIFYTILPSILNYPPDSINNQFQSEIDAGLSYNQQYILIMLLCLLVGIIALKIKTANINQILKKDFKTFDKKNLKSITKLFNLPYSVYILSLTMPILAIISMYAISEGEINIGTIKITLVMITMQTLISLIGIVYCKKLVSNTLEKLEVNKKYLVNIVSMKDRIFVIMLPMILVALIFTSLIGYSTMIDEKSEYMFVSNEMLLNETFENKEYSYNDVLQKLKDIETLDVSDTKFIIFPDNQYITLDGTNLSDFFIKYTVEKSQQHNNRTYETYGIDRQGSVKKIKLDNGESIYVGVEFSVSSNNVFIKLVSTIILLFIINCIVLYYIAKSLADDTTRVTEALKRILRNSQRAATLPITSNDEIAELTIAFNGIQEITSQHLKEIKNNQEMLIEQERLASLGQMIGGIAHNLKTPIFSIAGGLEGLSDLVNEYDASIDNSSVTNEDMHEIASDMREWIEKLRDHISYMSDIITTVKGQTVALSESTSIEFSVTELFKRVDILMKHEIKNYLANLEITNNAGDENIIKGNINSLVQIIDNIISNALEAYGTNYEDKKIELVANIENNNLIISIKDYGPGISERAQKKLFKEMVTTKGKNGTGLGMFMSYSNIKAHFNGNLTYETELGKGTTFYITLPISK